MDLPPLSFSYSLAASRWMGFPHDLFSPFWSQKKDPREDVPMSWTLGTKIKMFYIDIMTTSVICKKKCKDAVLTSFVSKWHKIELVWKCRNAFSRLVCLKACGTFSWVIIDVRDYAWLHTWAGDYES